MWPILGCWLQMLKPPPDPYIDHTTTCDPSLWTIDGKLTSIRLMESPSTISFFLLIGTDHNVIVAVNTGEEEDSW
jgi:hypothetical protein